MGALIGSAVGPGLRVGRGVWGWGPWGGVCGVIPYRGSMGLGVPIGARTGLGFL